MDQTFRIRVDKHGYIAILLIDDATTSGQLSLPSPDQKQYSSTNNLYSHLHTHEDFVGKAGNKGGRASQRQVDDATIYKRPRIIRNATAPIHRPRPSWIEGYCVYHAPKRLWVDSDFVKIDDGKRYLMTDVTETLQTGNTAPLISNKLSA
ncbi:uncharacterized protein BO72DRAFT_482770 [Aspergillus fijiensis CBS 313.89]|uniref:Uncharacterized protein n=1 Tax=Aspergillus fijiensis CBS 313.89 TaxID=1448319 RepID=A0A8G1S095_9EURO|nr:uncharacterized protein BO72DRAFT_482770 [Aspergillus fijiensis CBS 313.89]RAK82124.1 hypothetical protein BO72DRAFT_482770 [Aspergillus fijiensis CBS 313.89]